ncbi:MAG: nucleotidyltransferase domain-containing protein [Wenzhouxiangella sp.]|nr:MAG: nucleotidyltransferase domain-containing protein [Wenzhouxiangella sp.]
MNELVGLSKVEEYLREQPDLRLAIIYGSMAAGRARPDSDLDVAVAGREPLLVERKMALISGLAELTGRTIDLVDLSTVGEPLLGQIIAGGRRVLGADRDHAELLRRHLFDQADFLPLRQRILRERREAWLQR